MTSRQVLFLQDIKVICLNSKPKCLFVLPTKLSWHFVSIFIEYVLASTARYVHRFNLGETKPNSLQNFFLELFAPVSSRDRDNHVELPGLACPHRASSYAVPVSPTRINSYPDLSRIPVLFSHLPSPVNKKLKFFFFLLHHGFASFDNGFDA